MARTRSPVRRWDGRCAPGWDTRDVGEARALQDAMLSRFITKQVYPFHPYYHELFDLNTFVIVLDNNVDVLEWVVEIRNRNDDPADVDEVWVYVCPTSVGEVSGLRERIVEDLRNALELTPDRVIVNTYEKMADQLVSSGDRMMTRVIDLRLPE